MDLRVADVGYDVVVVALLVLRQDTEVRQTGIFHLRAGQVVLADSLEVNHLGVEGPVMRITGRVAQGHTCKVVAYVCWQMIHFSAIRTMVTRSTVELIIVISINRVVSSTVILQWVERGRVLNIRSCSICHGFITTLKV